MPKAKCNHVWRYNELVSYTILGNAVIKSYPIDNGVIKCMECETIAGNEKTEEIFDLVRDDEAKQSTLGKLLAPARVLLNCAVDGYKKCPNCEMARLEALAVLKRYER